MNGPRFGSSSSPRVSSLSASEQGSGVGGSPGGGDGDGGRDGDRGSGSGGSGEVSVNGCVDYVDRSLAEANRDISWNLDLSLDPERCLAISVGQSVTWNGNFSFHPLSGFGGDTPNPIGSAEAGNTLEVTFAGAGTFGFICGQHVEMQGAIFLRGL